MSKKVIKVFSDYKESRTFDTNYNGDMMRHEHTIYILYEDGTWDIRESTFYTLLKRSDEDGK